MASTVEPVAPGPGGRRLRPSLWARLRARGVVRVAASYAAIASLLSEIASQVVPVYGLPGWTMAVLVTAAIVGFPIAIALAWFLELTPAGTVVDSEEDARPRPRVPGLRRYADVLIIGVLAIAVAYLLVERQTVIADAASEGIAVLPFQNLTGDPSQEYLSDGLSDTLIHFLSSASGLKVIARTSSFQFKGKNVDVREIGAKLGVGAVLEGSMQRSQDRLRVIAQLIKTSDGSRIWSKTFDRPLSDIFAIQDEIGGAVLAALQAAPRDTIRGPHAARPKSLAAYEAYLLGSQQLERRNTESVKEALAHFERAMELDPDYAQAHVGAAGALVILSNRREIDRDDGRKRARAAVDRALALDPDLGRAHTMLAWFEQIADHAVEAEVAHRRALEVGAGDAVVVGGYASYLVDQTRLAEAEQMFRKALELDPLSAHFRWELADRVFAKLGRHDEGLSECLRVIEIDPLHTRAYWCVGAEQDRLADMVRWWRKAYEISPRDTVNATLVGRTERWYGDPAMSDEIIDAEVARNPDSWMGHFLLAERYYERGDCASVLDVAQRDAARDPDSPGFLEFTGDCLARAGRIDEAIDHYRRSYRQLFEDPPAPGPDDADAAIQLAALLAARGDTGRARELVQSVLPTVAKAIQLHDGSIDQTGHHELRARAHAVLRHRDGTLSALRQFIDAGGNMPSQRLRAMSVYDWLNEDPEYQALLAELDAGAERVREDLRRKPALTDEDVRRAIDSARGTTEPAQAAREEGAKGTGKTG